MNVEFVEELVYMCAEFVIFVVISLSILILFVLSLLFDLNG